MTLAGMPELVPFPPEIFEPVDEDLFPEAEASDEMSVAAAEAAAVPLGFVQSLDGVGDDVRGALDVTSALSSSTGDNGEWFAQRAQDSGQQWAVADALLAAHVATPEEVADPAGKLPEVEAAVLTVETYAAIDPTTIHDLADGFNSVMQDYPVGGDPTPPPTGPLPYATTQYVPLPPPEVTSFTTAPPSNVTVELPPPEYIELVVFTSPPNPAAAEPVTVYEDATPLLPALPGPSEGRPGYMTADGPVNESLRNET